MKTIIILYSALFGFLLLTGCANQEGLGTHVAKLRAEQTYNPNASKENLEIIPSGSGERMEGAYQVYTGQQSEDLKGTESQFLEGFAGSP